jgi:tetratricopeptide (TPR) repeat protein
VARWFGRLIQGQGGRSHPNSEPGPHAPATAPDDAERLTGEVVRLYDAGRYREAGEVARRLADLQRERLGDRHPEYALALSNLGLIAWKQDDLAGAESLLNQAREIRREALGERHPLYAASLIYLAELSQVRGDPAGAEPMLRQALDVLKKAVGERDPQYATALTSLALLLERRGDVEAAQPLLDQVLEVCRAALGERHPHFATALTNRALVDQRRGDLAAAERLIRQALDVRRAALGERHPDVAASLSHLARLRADQGDLAAAETLLSQAVEIRRPILGLQHPDVVNDVQALDVVRRRLHTPAPQPDPQPAPAAADSNQPVPATLTPVVPETRSEAPAAGPGGRELLAGFHALSDTFARVGAALAGAAGRMRDDGLPPDPRLLDEAAAGARTFAALRDALARRLDADGPRLGLPPLPRSEGLGITALLTRAEALARAEGGRDGREAIRRRVLERLDRVGAIRHRDPGASDLLRPVVEAAEALRRALDATPAHAELPDEAVRLAEGSHPLAALLTLAADDPGPPLPDEEWAALHRTVAEAFGRPVAAAAARKHLQLPVPSPADADRRAAPGTHPAAADLTAAALGVGDFVTVRPGPGPRRPS